MGKDLLNELIEIHQHRDSVLDKMKKAEENRASLSPEVFSKAMSEFQQRLDELDKSFNTRSEDLKEILSGLKLLTLYCSACRSEISVTDYDRHNEYRCQ